MKTQEKNGLLLMPTAKVTKNVSAATGGGNVLCSTLISIKTKAWLYSFGCKRHRNPAHKTNMIRALVKPPKAHPKIRKITLYFTATIGEIITDMPYLCETEI
ncbi:hypothetical protein NXX96_18590 [Bacteroides fragilis]|nr:hypothetical protein [Bacteroides fragilis]